MEHQSPKTDLSRSPIRSTESYLPRLPTPETSRSSIETYDGGRTPESRRSLPLRDANKRPQSRDSLERLESLFHKPSSGARRDGGYTPRSPPYDFMDSYRPSLPPLKSLLVDNIASPPRTPKMSSSTAQPTPREPLYTSVVHKPLSLYPNKRPRLDILNPTSTVAAVNRRESQPSMPPDMTTRRLSMKSSFPFGDDGLHRSSDPLHRGIHSPERRCAPSNAPYGYSNKLAPLEIKLTPTMSAQPNPMQMYETPERTPRSTCSESMWPIRLPSVGLQGYSSEYSPFSSSSRNDSHYNHTSLGARHSLLHPPGVEDHYISRPRDYPYGTDTRAYGRVDHGEVPPHLDYASSMYSSEHPPDGAINGPYEYYYPKARKRSNLPKHSTEIMRAWFDQNIGNPYPSEDQKAIFANATGISLTQVSNWFINHRRRCPELRDKRAERRKS